MKQYWLVHIRNFDSFINYIGGMYNFGNDIISFKDYYYGEDYLYLFIRKHKYGKFSFLSYSRYEELIRRYDELNELIVNGKFEYKGEYHGRREKLERLEIISKG